MKKFSVTSNTITKYGRSLYQIKANFDFDEVKKGDLGGWIESEKSLGDDVWIYSDAYVFKEAIIHGGEIRGGMILGGEIHGGKVWSGDIRGGVIRGGLINGGDVWGGEIRGGTILGGLIHGGLIHGGLILGGEIFSGAILDGEIRGGEIRGGTILDGEIRGGVLRGGVIQGGVIEKDNHIGFDNVSTGHWYLFAYIIDKKIRISCGCFNGTIDAFYMGVEKTHGDDEHGQFFKLLRQVIEQKLNKFIEA